MRSLLKHTSTPLWAFLLAVLFFISCAEAVPLTLSFTTKTYGFWHGLLHGFILPFSFIGSLFDESIAVYAINNTGGWYDFGFAFGASIIFGGSGRSANRRKKKDR